MLHPFTQLKPEYEALLASMRVRQPLSVDLEARRIVQPHTGNLEFAKTVAAKTGVPTALILALDYRESGNDPSCSLGQGDKWNRISTHAPRGMGPFKSRAEAAAFYVRYDNLDIVSTTGWSWAYACWKAEIYNGFGPRDHGIHSGYLWAATSHYQTGKYVRDGVWDPHFVDQQIGVIPLMRRLVALEPSLALAEAVEYDHTARESVPVGVSPLTDTMWLQQALNKLLPNCELIPLSLDGNYGRRTRGAVREFQRQHHLSVDGLAGPDTKAAINVAIQQQGAA